MLPSFLDLASCDLRQSGVNLNLGWFVSMSARVNPCCLPCTRPSPGFPLILRTVSAYAALLQPARCSILLVEYRMILREHGRSSCVSCFRRILWGGGGPKPISKRRWSQAQTSGLKLVLECLKYNEDQDRIASRPLSATREAFALNGQMRYACTRIPIPFGFQATMGSLTATVTGIPLVCFARPPMDAAFDHIQYT